MFNSLKGKIANLFSTLKADHNTNQKRWIPLQRIGVAAGSVEWNRILDRK